MLLRNEVTHASDVELLAAVIGNRRTAQALLKKAGGSLFHPHAHHRAGRRRSVLRPRHPLIRCRSHHEASGRAGACSPTTTPPVSPSRAALTRR